MQIETLKGFLESPFKTFVIRTASGESHEVTRLASISPKGDFVFLWRAEGGFVFVQVDRITEIIFPGRKRG